MAMSQTTRFFQFRFWPRAAGCAALVALADFLFYHPGANWTVGVFAMLLLDLIVLYNPRVIASRAGKIVLGAGIGLAAATVIEGPAPVTCLMMAADAVALVLMPRYRYQIDARNVGVDILDYAATNGRLYKDMSTLLRASSRRGRVRFALGRIARRWLLPIAFSAVFIALFSAANPLIDNTLSVVDWLAPLQALSVPRIMFWMATAWACWGLIRPKVGVMRGASHRGALSRHTKPEGLWFNRQSIVTSLILFNGLFAIQNLLDLLFLWSGAGLPAGMTYAEYAHRGAYPLMITALLAAAFVLIALKPGSSTEKLPAIRLLVYAWVGQNIFLVLSCVLRMDRYIAEYSLTGLRVYTLEWMSLTAVGLVLIVYRIHADKSNRWLINANVLAVIAMLYAGCFIDVPGAVAQYNVEHCREITGRGAALDFAYLRAEHDISDIPALAWLIQRSSNASAVEQAAWLRADLEAELAVEFGDWRQWSFRKARLAVLVARQP